MDVGPGDACGVALGLAVGDDVAVAEVPGVGDGALAVFVGEGVGDGALSEQATVLNATSRAMAQRRVR